MSRPGFVLEVDERTPPLLFHNGEGFRLERLPLGSRVVYPPESLPGLLARLKTACREHEGRTPLFVHVLLPEQEVVLRVKELGVDPVADLVAKVEGLLGPGSILVEYAGRA